MDDHRSKGRVAKDMPMTGEAPRVFRLYSDCDRYASFETATTESQEADHLADLHLRRRVHHLHASLDLSKATDPPDVTLLRSYIPVVSAEAWLQLRSLVGDSARPIEILHHQSRWVGLDVKVYAGAIDEMRSSIARFPDGGTMFIDHYVFSGSVPGPLFRLSQTCGTEVLAREDFIDAVAALNLGGLTWKPVSSQLAPAR